MVEKARRYVRAVWPDAQKDFEDMIEHDHYPWNAAFNALNMIDGLSWSHTEALEAAGLDPVED